MPIRKRNALWQADIISASGTRVRKSFPTKAEAHAFVKGNQPPPKATSPSGGPSHPYSGGTRSVTKTAAIALQPVTSSPPAVAKTQTLSPPPTSPLAVNSGQTSGRVRVSGTIPVSAGGSPSSTARRNASPESHTSTVQTLQPASSPTRSLNVSSQPVTPPPVSSSSCAAMPRSARQPRTGSKPVSSGVAPSHARRSGTARSPSPSLHASGGSATPPSPSPSTPIHPSSSPSARRRSGSTPASPNGSKPPRE
jgi:hypothetical protein